jgi:hypothetical protein
MRKKITEAEFVGFLEDVLTGCDEDVTFTSFEEAGVHPGAHGLVIRFGNPGGPEFHVEVAKVRGP